MNDDLYIGVGKSVLCILKLDGRLFVPLESMDGLYIGSLWTEGILGFVAQLCLRGTL